MCVSTLSKGHRRDFNPALSRHARLALGLTWSRMLAVRTPVAAMLLAAVTIVWGAPHTGRADTVAAAGATRAGAAPTPTPVPTPTPFAVSIDKDGFHPQGVRISPGQSVTWTNVDTVQHTATAADGSWDTGPIDGGKSVTLQFFDLGHWDYLCGFKPALRATLIVATPSPSPSRTAAPQPQAQLVSKATPMPTPGPTGPQPDE